MSHINTSFYDIMSSIVPSSLVTKCPSKLKVIFCVHGVISSLLSNIYLNEVDKMLERAKEVTRRGQYTNMVDQLNTKLCNFHTWVRNVIAFLNGKSVPQSKPDY